MIAVCAMLALSAFFMANVIIPAEARYVSAVNVVLFAVPSFWATKMWLGTRDAVWLWIILGVYALFVETAALATGFPYGSFIYSELLGYKLFGLTPWTVSLAWTPLVIGAFASAKSVVRGRETALPGLLSRTSAVVLATVLLTAFDLVVDPGAVRIGFWRYEGGGDFYAVPWSNFGGWLLSSLAAMLLVEIFLAFRRPLLPIPVQLLSSTFFIMVLWTAVCGFAGLWIPFIIGVGLLVAISLIYLRGYYAFDDVVVYAAEDGTPIGTAPKLLAHDHETRLHKAFSVFIFNPRGELLLQQRALHKKTWPGVWSNSCCGHVMLHESVEHAARRRLRYELGLTVSDLRIVLPDFRYRAEKDAVVENELCPVLIGTTDTEPRPNPAEVNDIRWIRWTDFVVEVADPANGYSPWAREEVELLAATAHLGNGVKSLSYEDAI